jgi:hypothetical protein
MKYVTINGVASNCQPYVVGTIALIDGKLKAFLESPDDLPCLQRILRKPAESFAGGKMRIIPNSDPEAWLGALCTTYRATMLSASCVQYAPEGFLEALRTSYHGTVKSASTVQDDLSSTQRSDAMQTLIDKAWMAYQSAPIEVRYEPSIPNLYLGDYEAFRGSELRIVTVGLNPGPYSGTYNAYKTTQSDEEAWNQYFVGEPKRWFTCLECVLGGFDASFYGKRPNTALHTDMLSPVSTKPRWSKLEKRHRKELEKLGVPLWHKLIEHLRPHILLLSVAEKCKRKIEFPVVQDWRTRLTFTETKSHECRNKPYELSHAVMRLSDDFKADVVFGPAAQKPFALLCNRDKARIGEELRGQLENWR